MKEAKVNLKKMITIKSPLMEIEWEWKPSLLVVNSIPREINVDLISSTPHLISAFTLHLFNKNLGGT